MTGGEHSLPLHVKPATRLRRIVAGTLNFFIFSVVVFIAGLTGAALGFAVPREVTPRLMGPVFLLLWILTVMVRSPGATICLLEIRDETLRTLSLKRRTLRALPWLGIGGIFAPLPSPSIELDLIQAVVGFAAVVAIAIDGGVLLVSGRSLYERLFRVVVLQVCLPDHLKPRLFGVRIS